MPAEQFVLRETLTRRPKLKFEIDRVVAHDTARVIPFVWVSGEGLEDLTALLDANPSVKNVELLTETDEERFYRLEWADEAQIIGRMVIEFDASVQQAFAADEEWTLHVLFLECSGPQYKVLLRNMDSISTSTGCTMSMMPVMSDLD
ncbi:bacterio-opsin activator domain-containing protein [Haladaptatus halobius]|uniref:bacterio-opsin activator domain-containing protein n=1 Tax=Haladaptatus halobius TaxID=2884875 RepID=UPI001D09F839|nr:bacterio-opsin activator domain-containing protein [Haladaptatus halobius]